MIARVVTAPLALKAQFLLLKAAFIAPAAIARG